MKKPFTKTEKRFLKHLIRINCNETEDNYTSLNEIYVDYLNPKNKSPHVFIEIPKYAGQISEYNHLVKDVGHLYKKEDDILVITEIAILYLSFLDPINSGNLNLIRRFFLYEDATVLFHNIINEEKNQTLHKVLVYDEKHLDPDLPYR